MTTAPNTARFILGTAGHVDHGKTSLVKTLTGVDTDRLKEEKERGITIELGFAKLVLPNGSGVGVVDVPGHERFVKNMVAGAMGIDGVMLVVAADEGVMPQTREHLEICSLLGVERGVIALTKVDMVDAEMAELASEDVREYLLGTFLEEAPIVEVSSETGAGIKELLNTLEELVSSVPPKGAKGVFRLPVDRVFTMKGFGTVVTGTLLSGVVKVDDEIEVVPRGNHAKVRGIQVHGEIVDKGYAGQRVALNFSGLDLADVGRGDTISHPETLDPSHMIDARIELLPTATKPMGDREKLRLHVGTTEVPVTVALLEADELYPGDSGFAQLRSSETFVAHPGDRFVLRSYSPQMTVGGGVVLDHRPKRHKGRSAEVVGTLTTLAEGEAEERLAEFLTVREAAGLSPGEAQASLNVTLDKARSCLQKIVKSGEAKVVDKRSQLHVASATIEKLAARALSILKVFHDENPLKKGLGLQELRSKFPGYIDSKVVEYVIGDLSENKKVVVENEFIRSADFTATLSADDAQLRSDLVTFMRKRVFEAPTLEEAAVAVGQDPRALKPVLDYLTTEKVLLRTKEGFYFLRELMDELAERVIGLLAERGQITVGDIKEITGTTRKYTIPIVEFLDTSRVTMRNGDVRVAGVKGKRR